MCTSGRAFLATMVCVLSLLLVFSFWTLRSNRAAGAFEIFNVTLKEEAEGNRGGSEGDAPFTYGTRQVCLRFDYARATSGDSVQVQWFFRDRAIHAEMFRLPPGDGSKAFCLLQEEGFPLPSGSYSVRISIYDKVLSDLAFEIVKE